MARVSLDRDGKDHKVKKGYNFQVSDNDDCEVQLQQNSNIHRNQRTICLV